MSPSPLLRRASRLAFLVTFGVVSCKSAVSTHVTPNPNGGGWCTNKLRGVPVTVKVPTHLEIRVVERRFLAKDGKGALTTADKHPVVARHVEMDVREKDEVFTVDAVRPASGTLAMKATFDENEQFFKTYNSKVEDKTIQSITDALKNITGEIAKLPGGKSTSYRGPETEQWKYVEHLVAVMMFDVHDPNLEAHVREFLHLHINGCTPDCQPR